MIGIRIADGSFFPVLEENSGRRKLVLTAANKGQDKVRIDFVSDNYHLGTIFLDDIRDDSDIELVMESVGKTLIATATDTRTGNRGILNAVLPDAVPKQEASQRQEPEPENVMPQSAPEPVKKPEKERTRENGCGSATDRTVRSLLILLIIMTTVLTFLAGAAVYALVNIPTVLERGSVAMFSEPENVMPQPAPEPQPQPEPVKPEPEKIPEPEPVKPAVAPEPVPEPEFRHGDCCIGYHPPAAYRECPYRNHRMPPVIPPQPRYYVPEYIRYKVKYGDTLWSIARTFCSDPYMYLEIARENRIADPTRIYPGTILMIRVR